MTLDLGEIMRWLEPALRVGLSILHEEGQVCTCRLSILAVLKVEGVKEVCIAPNSSLHSPLRCMHLLELPNEVEKNLSLSVYRPEMRCVSVTRRLYAADLFSTRSRQSCGYLSVRMTQSPQLHVLVSARLM